MPSPRLPRVLAIASGGGHWVQLRRIVRDLPEAHVTYVTTLPSYRSEVGGSPFHVVQDASRWDRLKLLKMVLQVAWIVLRLRPEVLITTGAAPGYVALRLARLIGTRTIWIDSIANVEELSLSGQKAGKYADLWLTQWPHLAREEGPFYAGSVL